MYPVYYNLAGNFYSPSDIEDALKIIEPLANNTNLPVRIAIESNYQLDTLIGVTDLTYTKNTFQYHSIQGKIVTRRNMGPLGAEILFVICPTEKLLQSFQSYGGVQAVFVVPDMDSDQPVYHWLQLHSAKNLKTGLEITGIAPCPSEMNRAIGYLKDYSRRLGVDLTHTSIQQGSLAIVANTLKTYHITDNPDTIYRQALLRGLSHAEADVLVKYFMKKVLYPNTTNANYTNYWQTLQDSQWDNN